MAQDPGNQEAVPIGAAFTGPHLPGPVHVEPRGSARVREDHWLYIATNALTTAKLHSVRDPARRLSGKGVVPQVRYRVTQEGWHRVAEQADCYNSASHYETRGK